MTTATADGITASRHHGIASSPRRAPAFSKPFAVPSTDARLMVASTFGDGVADRHRLAGRVGFLLCHRGSLRAGNERVAFIAGDADDNIGASFEIHFQFAFQSDGSGIARPSGSDSRRFDPGQRWQARSSSAIRSPYRGPTRQGYRNAGRPVRRTGGLAPRSAGPSSPPLPQRDDLFVRHLGKPADDGCEPLRPCLQRLGLLVLKFMKVVSTDDAGRAVSTQPRRRCAGCAMPPDRSGRRAADRG
jgi:hypothetical protein